MVLIKTGSTDLDNLMYGGIKGGLVFDFFGENGSGKTQTCFSIITNFIKTYKDLMVFYIDTTGNFRIERILEMLRTSNDVGKEQTKDISDRIHFERIFTLRDQFNIIEEIKNSSKIDKIKLIIFDSVTSLFTTEAQIPIRHLRLRKMMHDLSLLSINEDIAIIVTNMIRNRIEPSSPDNYYPNYTKNANNNNMNYKKKSKIQEFMINSMSIHCHFRVNFAIKDLDRRMYSATLVQPSMYENVIFKVTKKGISNWTINDL